MIIQFMLSYFLNSFPLFLELGATILVTVAKGIWQTLQVIGVALQQVWFVIRDTFSSWFDRLVEVGKNLLGALIIGLTRGDWEGFKDKIGTLLQDTQPEFTTQGVNYGEMLTGGFESTLPELQSTISTGMAALPEAASKSANGLMAPVGTQLATDLGAGWDMSFPAVESGLLVGAEGMGFDMAENMTTGLTTGFDANMPALQTSLTESVTGFEPVGAAIVDNAQAGASTRWAEFEADLKTRFSNLSATIDAIVPNLQAIGIKFMAMIKDGATTGWASFLLDVWLKFSSLETTLAPLFAISMPLIGQLILVLIEEGFLLQWPFLVATVVTTFGTLQGIIGAVIGNVNVIGSEIVIGIATTLGADAQGLYATAGEVATGVLTALSAMKNTAGIGAAAAAGIAAGIYAGIPAAVAAAEALAAAVSAALNISWQVNSPSKVFQKIGSSVPEGIAKGIQDNSGLPINATVRMAQLLNENVRNMMLASARPNAIYNYNLTMPTTANPNDLRLAFELMEAWST